MCGVERVAWNERDRERRRVGLEKLVAQIKEALVEVTGDDILYGISVRDSLAGVVPDWAVR